jgi:hypothetical protein
MPVVPAIAADVNQKREIETLRTSGRHIGARPAEGSDHPAQHADETAPSREIQKDGGIRRSGPSRKRAAEIAVHHPFRLLDECRNLALPCHPIGLSPTRTPIMLIEMYDRKPGDPGDLPGEGRLSGAGTAKDENPPHRDNLFALSGPEPSNRRKPLIAARSARRRIAREGRKYTKCVHSIPARAWFAVTFSVMGTKALPWKDTFVFY